AEAEQVGFHGEPDPLGELEGGGSGGGWQEDDEFIAAVSGHQVRLPRVPGEDSAKFSEDLVAAHVSVTIVADLVVIQVQHHKREVFAVAARPANLLLAPLVE